MKKKYLIIFVFIMGCSFFRPYNYSVRVHNSGNNEINIFPFQLAQHEKHGDVEMGNVMPGGTKSIAPFYWTPVETINIEWQDLATTQKHSQNVQIKLPKQFTMHRDFPKTIILIVCEDQSVKVLYDVWNNETKDFITVNSEGIETDHRTIGLRGSR